MREGLEGQLGFGESTDTSATMAKESSLILQKGTLWTDEKEG